jgi:hypothetical protein
LPNLCRLLLVLWVLVSAWSLAHGALHVSREIDRANEYRNAAEVAARLLDRRVPPDEVVGIRLPAEGGVVDPRSLEFFYRLRMLAFPRRLDQWSAAGGFRHVLSFAAGRAPEPFEKPHTLLAERRSLTLVEVSRP